METVVLIQLSQDCNVEGSHQNMCYYTMLFFRGKHLFCIQVFIFKVEVSWISISVLFSKLLTISV